MTCSITDQDIGSILIILWNIKITYDVRKELVQNFGSFFISSPYYFIIHHIIIFSFEIISFDFTGFPTFQTILCLQMFFLLKLLLFQKVLQINLFVYCIYYYFYLLFSSVLFLKNIYL